MGLIEYGILGLFSVATGIWYYLRTRFPEKPQPSGKKLPGMSERTSIIISVVFLLASFLIYWDLGYHAAGAHPNVFVILLPFGLVVWVLALLQLIRLATLYYRNILHRILFKIGVFFILLLVPPLGFLAGAGQHSFLRDMGRSYAFYRADLSKVKTDCLLLLKNFDENKDSERLLRENWPESVRKLHPVFVVVEKGRVKIVRMPPRIGPETVEIIANEGVGNDRGKQLIEGVYLVFEWN